MLKETTEKISQIKTSHQIIGRDGGDKDHHKATNYSNNHKGCDNLGGNFNVFQFPEILARKNKNFCLLVSHLVISSLLDIIMRTSLQSTL